MAICWLMKTQNDIIVWLEKLLLWKCSWRYEYIFSPSWQDDPKSMSLISLRFGLISKIFSGFKSQWMTEKYFFLFSSSKTSLSDDTCPMRQINLLESSGFESSFSEWHNCWANFLVRLRETPLKLVLRKRSYKLLLKSSKTRHRCDL